MLRFRYTAICTQELHKHTEDYNPAAKVIVRIPKPCNNLYGAAIFTAKANAIARKSPATNPHWNDPNA